MKEPELVTATQEELDEILLRARPALSEQQYRLLEGALATFVYVMLKLQNAKTSLKRFQRMLQNLDGLLLVHFFDPTAIFRITGTN